MKYNDPSNTKPFAELHCVKQWSQLVFESAQVQRTLTYYAECKVYRHLLLYGPYGSAKSTIARLLVQERDNLIGVPNGFKVCYVGRDLNSKMAALENAFSMLHTTHNFNLRPYVIIDEVDQLTPVNQEVLRGLMDTLPFGKMILTTNSLNKIDGGVADRCDKLQINQPNAAQWLPRAKAILAAEGIQVPDIALLAVLENTGSARDVMVALEDLVTQAHAQTQTPIANIIMLPSSGADETPKP